MIKKYWGCPECGRTREWKFHLVYKICPCCMIPMEVVEEVKNES